MVPVGSVDLMTADVRGGLYADAPDPWREKLITQHREGYNFLEKVRSCKIQSANGRVGL